MNSHEQKVIADDSPREMERVNLKKWKKLAIK